jgi:cardiolipin synthase
VLLSTILRNPVKVTPLFVYKANTAVQIILAAVVLAELAIPTDLGPVRGVLIAVSFLLTAASAAAYLVGWLRHMGGYAKSETRAGRTG